MKFFISDVCSRRCQQDSLKKIAAISFFISLLIVRSYGHLFAYEEPDNFAGLKFGEDLTTQMEKCSSFAPRSGPRCYQPLGTIYSLYNVGEIQRELKRIFAHQVDGKLAAVTLNFDTSRTSVFFSILTERYGEPTTQTQEPWVSKGGVKTTSTLAIWKGRNVSIRFKAPSIQIDEGKYLLYDGSMG